ncbi:Chromatin-remodeling complexes subunit NGG1 [Candida viswanathii]|uniref:Chromatin-remodeling complexes subunit NGG1 n=1 Tax=Candida viswanathii TaxID=5486 RepID=A0A367XQE0_9ASCO|nr:Chromatin-remodeling complexes subunit NGG1 [Candida viswanathii]
MSEFPSASTTLDDIVTELKLTYDSSVGLLEGDAIRTIPNINTLTNLNKLLKNLWKQLNDVETIDDDVLRRIEAIKEEKLAAAAANDKKRKADEMEADAAKAEGEKEATNKDKDDEKDVDDDDDDDDDVPINIAKKRKLSSEVSDKAELTEDVKVKTEEPAPEVKEEEREPRERLNSKDDPIPPVQSGTFTQDNDTRLKNPKSEYVEPQTLSADAIAELGLFSEDNNGLETQGKDYLKKKYGVASYPERDLQELLPGEIPSIDFSKNKPPTNQVQFTTFQSYIESYFRPFLNEDIKLLNERNVIPPGFEKQGYDPDLTPFVIPKLGRFYSDVWTEEDSTLGSKLNTPGYQQPPSDSYLAKGSIDDLTDDRLYTEDISCGPLSNRLLSAILSTREGGISDDEDGPSMDSTLKTEVKDENKPSIIAEDEVATQLNSEEDYKVATDTNDFQSVEERLKRELKYIGIFMNLPSTEDGKTKTKQPGGRASKKSSASIIDNDEWIKNKEDDEVCAEIRQLQKQLKEVTSRNRANRKKIIPLVEEHIAYQEYCAILEDLDKQVDLAYMKRLKGKGKKKKADVATPQQQAINSGLRALLEKRKRWIDNIGKLFPVAEKMKRVPSESILIKDGTVEAEQNEDDNAETGTSAVDILTQKSI